MTTQAKIDRSVARLTNIADTLSALKLAACSLGLTTLGSTLLHQAVEIRAVISILTSVPHD